MAQTQRGWYGRLADISEKEDGRPAQRASHPLFWRTLAGIGISLATGMGVFGELPGGAQSITLDGSLGPIRSLGNGPVYVIRQTDGTTVGTNLFHSFGRFNLATGELAGFQSTAAIRNILARVTGESVSSIDGLILTGSGAVNFFLINPNGIIFGPNANLNIGGTTRGDFTATTVDAIVWPDGSRFDAVTSGGPQPLLRIVGDPSGFVTTQRSIPGITVDRSRLRVYDTQDLRLLGGAVETTGARLDAWGGRVEIGAIAGAGEVGLVGTGSFRFPQDLERGNVGFRNNSIVDVTLNDGGDIQITGRDIDVVTRSLLRAGIARGLGTSNSRAGTLRLDGTGTVTIAGPLGVANLVGQGATGQGGALIITAKDLVIRDGAEVAASMFGTGKAGELRLTATDRIVLQNALIANRLESMGVGQGGNVVIIAPVVEVDNNTQISTSTFNQGDAGSIQITARERVLLDNSEIFSRVGSTAQGQGGSVKIDTAVLEVQNRAQISTSTSNRGDVGDIQLTASDRIRFDNGAAFSRVNATGIGQGGDIVLNAPILEVLNGSQLLANTLGQGDAGNILIGNGDRPSDQVLFKNDAAALTSAGEGAIGYGGNLTIRTRVLEVQAGSQLIAANSDAFGEPGNVTINATERVNLQGFSTQTGFASGIFTLNIRPPIQPDLNPARPDARNVVIETSTLNITDGAVIDARTIGDRPGGDINLTVDRLNVLNGGQIIAVSEISGSAGTITIKATDLIQIAGSDPNFAQRVALLPSTGQLAVPQSTLSVRSSGTGAAGDISLSAPRLSLTDQGQIIADSNAVTGGNITLNFDQAVVMRNGSLISATAGRQQGAGDGGNITLNAPFVLSLPGENNDIIANAFSGTGGNITINADAILNFTLNDKGKTFEQLRGQSTNDISASSQFGSPGILNLSGLNVNPAQGIAQLPVNTQMPQPLQGCETVSDPGVATRAAFFTTGRGGLPASPNTSLGSDTILEDLRWPSSLSSEIQPTPSMSRSTDTFPVEATHWFVNAQGQVVLTADPSPQQRSNPCYL